MVYINFLQRVLLSSTEILTSFGYLILHFYVFGNIDTT